MREKFDWSMLSMEDWLKAKEILKVWSCQYREDMPPPDLVIAPDGKPYLYRWHVVPRNRNANVYLHIQVGDDPARPLHDHPWDNMSVILSGGYTEIMSSGNPDTFAPKQYQRRKGDVVFRNAEWSHRLLIAPGVPYTMTLFSTGPKRNDWGFYYPSGKKSWELVTTMIGTKSVHLKQGEDNAQTG